MVLAVLYNGATMMVESQITVGDLTSFLIYTVYVGISIAGNITVYVGISIAGNIDKIYFYSITSICFGNFLILYK